MRACLARALLAAFLVDFLAGVASAQISGYSTVQANNTAGGEALAGFVTNDILVDFTGQLSGIQLLTDLQAGTIYQTPVFEGGGDTAPNDLFFQVFPSLEFDTFYTLGGPTTATADVTPGLAGGAVSIGGASSSTFSDSLIDVAFFPPGGVQILDQTGYYIARITLSDDTNGELTVFGSTGSVGDLPAQSIPIVNGVIGSLVPPPVLVGDFDGSGVVSGGDLDLVLLNWGQTDPTGSPAGWTTLQPHDGRVTQNELDAVLQNWGRGLSPDFAGAAVPEPGVVAGWFVAAAAFRRRR